MKGKTSDVQAWTGPESSRRLRSAYFKAMGTQRWKIQPYDRPPLPPKNSFIHLVVCLTTGPKLLPKRALHIVRSRASSFKWEYPLLSVRSSNTFLRLLPCLPVTSVPSFIFPSVTRCRRQFRHKKWPIQFAFRLCISCTIFLSSVTLSNTSSFFT